MACAYERNAVLNDTVASLIDSVLASAPRFSETDEPVIIGCSGGPDSAALVALSAHAGVDAFVVYVDHGLRAASADDFAVVSALARRFGFEAAAVTVSIDASANVEARARDARHGALETVRAERGAGSVWLAHTLDDQAETVLLALQRGSGLAGLSGMQSRRGRIERPLLGVRRSALRLLCADLGIATIDDPMNHNERFARVWVRDTLLPLLNDRNQRDLVPVLARQAALLRTEHEFLEQLAAEALRSAATPEGISARALRGFDAVVVRRAVRQLVGHPAIGGRHVEAALAVVYGERNAVELPLRRTLRRSGGILMVDQTPPRDADATNGVGPEA